MTLAQILANPVALGALIWVTGCIVGGIYIAVTE
jgi:hypothetical protein